MAVKRAVKWAVLKAVIQARKRLSDTGMSITAETPQRDELPMYQEVLDFRVRESNERGSRGFPVSLEDSERFAREVLEMAALVRKRLAKKEKKQ